MNDVDVTNIALQEIGAQATVSRINPSDGSPEANAASILYRPKLKSLLRAAHWNCARKQVALTQLKATVINGAASDDPPPRPWLYEYAYPSDCLLARFILPIWDYEYTGTPFTTNETIVPYIATGPAVKFIVSTDIVQEKVRRVILTNMPRAILVYTYNNEDPDLWDPHFLNAMTSSFGAWLINALNRNRSLLQDQINIATGIINEARITDGNEGLTSQDHLPDWMAARAQGAGWGYGDGYTYGMWASMDFPGGFSF